MPAPGTYMESSNYRYFAQTNADNDVTPISEVGDWTGNTTQTTAAANSFKGSGAPETLKVALAYNARISHEQGNTSAYTSKFETTIFGSNDRTAANFVSQGKTHTNYLYPSITGDWTGNTEKVWVFNVYRTYWYIRVKITVSAIVLDTNDNDVTVYGKCLFTGNDKITRIVNKTKTMIHGAGLQVMTGEDQYVRFGKNQNLINGDLAISGSAEAGGTGYFTNNLTVGDIEANTSYPMYVVGDIAATGNIIAYVSSDERLKADITPLSDSLEKLKRLTPIDFSWKDRSKGWGTQSPRDIGLIAQEVEKEFPTMVGTMADGYKGIRYDRLVPVLVDSIKTQDKKIEKLEAFVKKLINDLEEE